MTETSKEKVINDYKKAKEKYLKDINKKNWIEFCDEKRKCMLLGIRI